MFPAGAPRARSRGVRVRARARRGSARSRQGACKAPVSDPLNTLFTLLTAPILQADWEFKGPTFSKIHFINVFFNKNVACFFSTAAAFLFPSKCALRLQLIVLVGGSKQRAKHGPSLCGIKKKKEDDNG